MKSPDRIERLLRENAEREALTPSWRRQRQTAQELCRRFDAGSDTQLLADEVGMGKSYVALAVMADAVLRGGEADSRALLITPPSPVLRSKWEQEIRSFSKAYLKQRVEGALKPLILKSFWELVANLHNHRNETVGRLSQESYQCILLYLRQWAVRKGWLLNKHKRWEAMGAIDMEGPAAMAFASRYSIAAFEGFLETTNAMGNDFLHAMIRPGGDLHTNPEKAAATIKKQFKCFAMRQDTHEPNIFILGMNALRTPRSDSSQNQQFATFVLSVLLKGRHEQTRKGVIRALKRSNVLFKEVNRKALDALSGVDLYRTRDSVNAVLDGDVEVRRVWNEIVRDPAAIGQGGIKNFFADLLDRVISHKLEQSGIQLAVVDEVHNWKSGANGARDFRQNFADAIPRKLLMSATPFQLAEGEMRKVFGFAIRPGGPTQQVLDRMFGPGGLVDGCLGANQRFREAWSRLPPQDAERLWKFAEDDPDEDALVQRIRSAASDGAASTSLVALCQGALAYRTAVDRLLVDQRQIMIRHVKPRDRRQFHAGKDYMTAPAPRRALYKVPGRLTPGDAFINFLAMRLDQKIRGGHAERTGPSDEGDAPVNAHLARGMSSSKAAFRESRQTKMPASVQLSRSVQGYMDLFEGALDSGEHPKVAATVELALNNYLCGRKTLVFCERVATVKEIADSLRARIEVALGDVPQDVAAMKARIPRAHLFADIQWYRSWRRVSTSGVDLQDPKVHDAAVAFVQKQMQSVPLTERRVLRLLDLWFLFQETRVAGSKPLGGHRLLARLGELLDKGDEDARQHVLGLIADQSGDAADDKDEEKDDDQGAVVASIEDVFKHGFLSGVNLWVDPRSAAFDKALWKLVDDEANVIAGPPAEPSRDNLLAFYRILVALQTGIRRVALRADLLRRCLPLQAGESQFEAVYRGVREDRGGGESIWRRLLRFIDSLADANGTINPIDKTNTQRRSLWRGVKLRDESLVAEIRSKTKAEQRVQWCAAFNSPLAPEVLICTAIGSEGIDLHKECAEIIHHDLPWNPARLEQRIGRIDRVGSLSETLGSGTPIRVGIPFLAHNYDQFQYDKLLSRAQVFEVLLGTPEFDPSVDEATYTAAGEDSDDVREIDADEGATWQPAAPVLPAGMIDWLRVDLALPQEGQTRPSADFSATEEI
jgi:superfamily II DNA or RNA helicase